MTKAGEERAAPLILVVEDNDSLREGLAMNLRLEGYEVVTASDGEEGMRLAFDAGPDLVVLDIMLPAWSGLDILEELRKRDQDVPVLILSARHTTPDKVRGLKLGADDYLSKPFDLPELLARVEVMLRRRQAKEQDLPALAFGDVHIDQVARTVQVQGRGVSLSAREFNLLCLLAGAPGQVFTREAILERVWGWDYEGTERTVDNFIVRLRKKIGDHDCIETVPRVGYRLKADA